MNKLVVIVEENIQVHKDLLLDNSKDPLCMALIQSGLDSLETILQEYKDSMVCTGCIYNSLKTPNNTHSMCNSCNRHYNNKFIIDNYENGEG